MLIIVLIATYVCFSMRPSGKTGFATGSPGATQDHRELAATLLTSMTLFGDTSVRRPASTSTRTRLRKNTIFNEVAAFNPFELSFARFLANKCNDVLRFAALAEHFTGFWVDYLKPSGAIGRYFPDWVAIQRTADGEVSWIVETKGRVWDGTEQKDAAIRYWCSQVSGLTGDPWRYMRIDQPIWRPDRLSGFADLVQLISERNAAVQEQVLFVP